MHIFYFELHTPHTGTRTQAHTCSVIMQAIPKADNIQYLSSLSVYLHFKIFTYYCMCTYIGTVCFCVSVCVYATVHAWSQKTIFFRVLSFQHLGSKDQTQVIRFAHCKWLHQLSHLTRPSRILCGTAAIFF